LRWQQELAEFAETLSEAERAGAGLPLTWRDGIRIAAPFLLLLLAAVFFYLATEAWCLVSVGRRGKGFWQGRRRLRGRWTERQLAVGAELKLR
jgi:hypothetical protein